MRNELKHIELIENYLSGKLDSQEKIAFELELNTNSGLKEEVQLQQQIMNRLSLIGFTEEMENFHNEFITTEKGKGNFKWYLNTILILVFVGAASLGVYFVSDKSKKKKETATTTEVKVREGNPITRLAANKPSDKIGNSSLPDKSTNFFSNPTPRKYPTVTEPGEMDPDPYAYRDEDLFKKLQVPFVDIIIDAQEGGTFFTRESKSRIFIPGGIVQHEDGSPVEGEIIIRYREFRDAADMAFSEIPMKVKEGDEEMNLNSAGMIEIRAYQNGEELKVGKEKSFTIDMNVTSTIDDCFFWSLDDESQKWEKLKKIEYTYPDFINPEIEREYIRYGVDSLIEEDYGYGYIYGKVVDVLTPSAKIPYNLKFVSLEMKKTQIAAIKTDTGYLLPQIPPGRYMAIASADGYHSYTNENVVIDLNKFTELNIKLKPENSKIAQNAIPAEAASDSDAEVSLSDKRYSRRWYRKQLKNTNAGSEFLTRNEIPLQYKRIQVDFVSAAKGGALTAIIRTNNLIDTTGRFSAAKNYSKIASGLQCMGFGVYNCDQVRRINNPVQVRPSFSSTSTDGFPKKSNYLVLIDRDLNASFTFYNGDFTCNREGKNILLLYAGNKIYGVNETEFKSGLNNSSDSKKDFLIADLTSQLQSLEDLKKYLGL